MKHKSPIYDAFLAGKKIVTRDGRNVIDLHLFDYDVKYPLVGIVERESHNGPRSLTWTTDGRLGSISVESGYDLFVEEPDPIVDAIDKRLKELGLLPKTGAEPNN